MPETGMVETALRGDLRCPACANWILRGLFEGRIQVKCGNKRCAAQLLVEMRAGKPTVTVLSTKK
jgi:phage FluMu protein Com